MSLSAEAIAALEVLVARVEAATGRPCDLMSRLVLSCAARDLAAGRIVYFRANGHGVVVSTLRAKEPAL
jgi:hypothetical protein